MQLTYKQAYDKIIDAYFKDEIQPMRTKFCFCGTLHGGSGWSDDELLSPYTYKQYQDMEWALLEPLSEMPTIIVEGWYVFEAGKKYEDLLFIGMCAALDVLKTIHYSRGEDVDSLPATFTKRKLVA